MLNIFKIDKAVEIYTSNNLDSLTNAGLKIGLQFIYIVRHFNATPAQSIDQLEICHIFDSSYSSEQTMEKFAKDW